MTKKNKKVTFFVVQSIDDCNAFLTIVCDKKDAIEFILKLLKLEKLNHFQAWCNLRNLDPSSDAAWSLYFNTCVPKEDKMKYVIRKIYYKLNDVGAILRMFGGCSPLGCKFDTPQEYDHLKQVLETQKLKEQIELALNDVGKKMMESEQHE